MSAMHEAKREARNLLVGSILRYRSTLAASERLEQRYADPECPPAGPAERAARERLRGVADEAWDLAEAALGEAIGGLYDLLAPPGRRACEVAEPYHVTRAVRYRGWVYVLVDPVGEFTTTHRVVAAYRETMVVGLARRKRSGRS